MRPGFNPIMGQKRARKCGSEASGDFDNRSIINYLEDLSEFGTRRVLEKDKSQTGRDQQTGRHELELGTGPKIVCRC